jgi:hypothetical protein
MKYAKLLLDPEHPPEAVLPPQEAAAARARQEPDGVRVRYPLGSDTPLQFVQTIADFVDIGRVAEAGLQRIENFVLLRDRLGSGCSNFGGVLVDSMLVFIETRPHGIKPCGNFRPEVAEVDLRVAKSERRPAISDCVFKP